MKAGATWAVIIGAEVADEQVALKNLATGEQSNVAVDLVAASING